MTDEPSLEEHLSRPLEADVAAARALDGDLLILGVSGKMGPTLARLAKRAAEKAGVTRRVIGVARFSDPAARGKLEAHGIETVRCDLLDRNALEALPDCANVLFMTGQKFGTSAGQQARTWAINAYLPAMAAERFRDARIVAFSTGNVYPLTDVASGGPVETGETGPVGEYAQSALGRERMLAYVSERHGTRTAILRLNYANEPRYGVLRDIADRVWAGEPVDLAMGYVNVVWQRYANAVALRAFAHVDSPPFVLNLTGVETVAVREIASRFGEIWGKDVQFAGAERETALLNNAALCREMFGPPDVELAGMIAMTAEWIAGGGGTLGKPTHFGERTGKF